MICECRTPGGVGYAALAGFLGLCGFRTLAGLILSGLSTLSGGSGLKYTRQPGLSWDCCLTMQAVTRLTSGISALHNRNASPLQACSSSAV
jgi:hypothetical protein